MPVQIPDTLRRALGPEATVDFVPVIQQVVAEIAVPRDEYRNVLSRLDALERDVGELKTGLRELRREMNERFDRMNERFDQMYQQFGARFDQMYQHFETICDRQNRHIEARFDAMNDRLDRLESRIDERLDKMNERLLSQTRWMVGTIALFGTLITVLLAISQFTP